MRAAVIHAAKDLRLDERPEPTLAPGDVLVRFGAGGICGSDLSYWGKGRVGDFALREPLVLGHEVAGEIEALGEGVSGLAIGQRVAVNPSRPCLHCDYCRAGAPISAATCASSARRRCSRMCRAALPSASPAAPIRPCRCRRHAARQGRARRAPVGRDPRPDARGRSPGQARSHHRRGADRHVADARRAPCRASFVAVTDLVDEPLALARQAGADETINVATSPEASPPSRPTRASFDVGFEATGAPPALGSLVRAIRRAGASCNSA